MRGHVCGFAYSSLLITNHTWYVLQAALFQLLLPAELYLYISVFRYESRLSSVCLLL